jgi:hypothetical protein
VYEPLVVAVYVSPVAPPIGLPSRYHWPEKWLGASSCTEPPAQNVVVLTASIVVSGDASVVTVVATEAELLQPEVVTTTVK